MRKLIGLVVVLVLAYSGYWFYGSRQILHTAKSVVQQARLEGWGDAQDVTIAGFPSRFDLTLDHPSLRSPDGLWSWTAPLAQLFALGYAPNKLIAYVPSGQTVTLGRTAYRLDQQDMRASLSVGYASDLPLKDAVAVLKDPVLTPEQGSASALKADQIRLAVAQEDKAQGALPDPALKGQLIMPGATYRLGAEAVNLTLPHALVEKIAPGADLPPTVARLHFDALAGLSGPVALSASQAAPPQLMTFALSDLSLSWGGNDLSAKGNLRIDANGQPEGTLKIRSATWRNWISVAQGMGLIGGREVSLITGVAQMLAANDPQGALEVPLEFKDGQMRLGPIPLGPAPSLSALRQG
ncbi:hypothetical protein DL1_00900 [Thioclava dalianensis]|uniref:DUF2125 domain-containing protein n=1 Tax=Thioclava dalianensis TaxID=1185766 RepID=A0A074TS96_9RHOB|nr:DUF2125 domain-containing protein [Thioclava dalianensis]KEP71773.1 hypothetical protein DL1_00900 [Thioclava dalianensis]SFN43464.1 hypothetical protein SAMN05216224_105204 [Thioclava dalianensis]